MATSTIAWAQMSLGTATGYVYDTRVISIQPPNISIDKKDTGTETSGELKIKVYFEYVEVRVALVDLGNLYESMDKFFITFKKGTAVFAVLSLDGPTTTFIYDARGQKQGDEISIDIVVSWKAKEKVKADISYGVAAEVIGVYGSVLPQQP
jgi:hypothetical protein